MTDEAKALVEALRPAEADRDHWGYPTSVKVARKAADLIETQAREIERLRVAISAALRCTPQARHGAIIYDCGDPWEILTAALTGDSHD
jgi:hypothetical protein